MFQFEPGQISTIIPETSFTDKHGKVKPKGEKVEGGRDESRDEETPFNKI